MTLQINRLLYDVEAYYKMAEVGIIKPTDRVELIEGEIITMSPIKSLHASVVNALVEELVPLLKRKATTTIQNPLRINKYSEPEPDFIIAKYRRDRYAENHPQPKDTYIVIEVSDSTLQYDRKVKLPLYAKAGVPEYWIVDVKKKQIEQYTKPEGEKYLKKKTFGRTKTIQATTIDCAIQVGDLFV